MNHRPILWLFVLLAAGPAIGSGWLAVAQQPPSTPLDDVLRVLTSDDAGLDDYLRASRELTASGAEAVPLLVEKLPASSDSARLRILGTLSRIGEPAAPALPEVRRLLQQGSPSVRAASAACLRALGPAGRAALPDLFKALGDSDTITLGTAARAIGALDPDFVRVRLQDLLDRLGTSPLGVDKLPLDIWHGITRRSIDDPDLARDLRHWMLVVRYTGRRKQRIGGALGLERLGEQAPQKPVL